MRNIYSQIYKAGQVVSYGLPRIWLFVLLSLPMAPLAPMAAQGNELRVLLVDETKTFTSTMRVGALAQAIEGVGAFELTVILVDVETGFTDPLIDLSPPQIPFDALVIVPREVDAGLMGHIWLVAPPYGSLALEERQAVVFLNQLVENTFQGIAKPVDQTEDLYPLCLYLLYHAKGWLR